MPYSGGYKKIILAVIIKLYWYSKSVESEMRHLHIKILMVNKFTVLFIVKKETRKNEVKKEVSIIKTLHVTE